METADVLPTAIPQSTASFSRHSRQVLFTPIGNAGQERLRVARVAIVGCGALGTVAAELLCRAGVGKLTLLDRDIVELSNLQRQSLFTEGDAEESREKARAAAEALQKIDSSLAIRPIVADLQYRNAERLLSGHDLLLDATDNFAARFLLNDVAWKTATPWIYGAAVGDEGTLGVFRPGLTPCLRCLMEILPPPGSTPTCDTSGVIGPITHVIASLQTSEALKLLVGNPPMTGIAQVSLWSEGGPSVRRVLENAKPWTDCPTCVKRLYPALSGEGAEFARTLCGRDSVQLIPESPKEIDLEGLAEGLSRAVRVSIGVDSVTATFEEATQNAVITLFKDGRAIVKGTLEPARARSLLARYVGW